MQNNLISALSPETIEKLKAHIKSLGLDFDLLSEVDKYTFDDYIVAKQKEILEAKRYNEYDESMNSMLDISADEYTATKELLSDVISNINEPDEDEKTYKFPYKEIFNGNFDTLDKSKLTDVQKQLFNVDGLLDEMYDIYYDKVNNKSIPIYYDYSTTNESFVSFTYLLQDIKTSLNIDLNLKVPLILFDRRLMGLDMHSEQPADIQALAVLELERNMFFYLREMARLKTKAGDKIQYQMTIGTYTILWLYCQCFNTFRCAPRQVGKTTDLNCLYGGEFAAASKNTNILVSHYKMDDAAKNRKEMVDFANLLPEFVKFHNIVKRIQRNKEIMEVGPDMMVSKTKYARNIYRNNAIAIFSAGTTEQTAERVGRGESFQFVQNDEMNFEKHAVTVSTAAQLAHSAARTLAEKNNTRYGIHYMSTAGKLNTKHGREMYDFIFNQMTEFDIKLFAYNYSDLKTYLSKTAAKEFFNVQFDYRSMGFDEAWLDDKIGIVKTREDFMTEILMKWLDVDSSSLFNQRQLGRIGNLAANQNIDSYMFDKYFRFIYFPVQKGESFEATISRYSTINVGVDISHGKGGDSTVYFGVDMETGEKVFMFKTNTLTTSELTMLIKNFTAYIKKTFPTLTYIHTIEVDGPGEAVVPDLMKDPIVKNTLLTELKYYSNMAANELVKSTNRQIDRDRYESVGIRQRNYRDYLYNTLLLELVDKYPHAFAHELALNELSTLYRKSTGKIDHKSGAHDDIIMATCLAYAPIFNANLRREVSRQFNFWVDMTKIKMSVTMQVVNAHTNEHQLFTKDEGQVTYEIVPYQLNGKTFERVRVFKVIKGKVTELFDKDKDYEINKGALKDEHQLKTLKQPSYADYMSVESRMNNTQTNNYSTGFLKSGGVSRKNRQNDWYNMNAKMF